MNSNWKNNKYNSKINTQIQFRYNQMSQRAYSSKPRNLNDYRDSSNYPRNQNTVTECNQRFDGNTRDYQHNKDWYFPRKEQNLNYRRIGYLAFKDNYESSKLQPLRKQKRLKIKQNYFKTKTQRIKNTKFKKFNDRNFSVKTNHSIPPYHHRKTKANSKANSPHNTSQFLVSNFPSRHINSFNINTIKSANENENACFENGNNNHNNKSTRLKNHKSERRAYYNKNHQPINNNNYNKNQQLNNNNLNNNNNNLHYENNKAELIDIEVQDNNSKEEGTYSKKVYALRSQSSQNSSKNTKALNDASVNKLNFQLNNLEILQKIKPGGTMIGYTNTTKKPFS